MADIDVQPVSFDQPESDWTTTDNNDEFPVETVSDTPKITMSVPFSPIPKAIETKTRRASELRETNLVDPSPVKNIVSRFETKQEKSLDALPFRTVRNFFCDAEQRSIHVSAEKQKYDALMAQQRKKSSTPRSSDVVQRLSFVDAEDEDNNKYESDESKAKETAIIAESSTSNQQDDTEQPEELEETQNEHIPPPPPPPSPTAELDTSQLAETPEQEAKKRPILTTERSFVMEDDHTIETEYMVVVGERFSEGEDEPATATAVLEQLEHELLLTAEDAKNITDALESNLSPPAQPLKKRAPSKKVVESKLFVPTAASLASRTTKNPQAIKKEKSVVAAAKSTPKPSTTSAPPSIKNKYANVKSKVAEIINAPSTRPSSRKDSNASDASYSLPSPASSSASASSSRFSARRGFSTSGAASVDRRSFISNKSQSGGVLSLSDLHGPDAHADWEGRHRSTRLSFGSSVSSNGSNDPFALQLSYSARKSRYDNVQPRYLDYGKSPVYTRNKEEQLERRKKLKEVNELKSVERQKQIKLSVEEREKRLKEDVEEQVRRGRELHALQESLREKERLEERERLKSQSLIRRALNGTLLDEGASTPSPYASVKGAGSSMAASSPRTSLLSEPDSTTPQTASSSVLV